MDKMEMDMAAYSICHMIFLRYGEKPEECPVCGYHEGNHSYFCEYKALYPEWKKSIYD